MFVQRAIEDLLAEQLHHELQDSIARALQTGRPVLTHLNGDTSWLLQIPRFSDKGSPLGRPYFNILFDPWFTGPQSDVASWFSTQYHVVKSSVQSVEELEGNLQEVEDLISYQSRKRLHKINAPSTGSYIDLVVISHEFTDHCHEATLREIRPTVPVFATDKAADLIRSFNHFDTVITTPLFSPETVDWRNTSVPPLPRNIGVSRVVTKGDGLYYHSAIQIAFNLQPQKQESAEAVFYAPHGIKAKDLEHIPDARPPIRTLVMLHGLHDVGIRLTAQLNLGAHNGLRAVRTCQARWWVGTHDEVKKGVGLLAPFLRRERLTIKEALDLERRSNGDAGLVDGAPPFDDIQFADLRSGESLVMT